MNRYMILVLALTLFVGPCCFAEGDNYKEAVGDLVRETRDLEPVTRQESIDRASLERWHKGFILKYGKFEKDFAAMHKQARSFLLVRDGADGFLEALGMLKQADYSNSQYTESITSNQVEYAHKWKKTEAEQKKKAYDAVIKAVGLIKSALEASTSE